MRINPCLLALVLTAGAAEAATLELVSQSSHAEAPGGGSGQVLSADGRYMAFLSSAPDLAPGQEDEDRTLDIFFRDRVLGTTTLVSHTAGSPTRVASPGIGISAFQSNLSLDMSADGRYVAFTAPGVDFVPGAAGSGRVWNVFLWDRVTGTTTLVSHAAGSPGTAADGSCSNVRISADGNFVAFTSLATNLVAGQVDRTDTPEGTADVFLWNRATDTTTVVSRRIGTAATTGNRSSFAPALSADGSVVVFATAATDLLPHLLGLGLSYEVYAYQRSTDTLSLVSRAATSPQVAAGAWNVDLAVSADGRYVLFTSFSANLVPGQMDDATSLDAFLYDRTTGEMRLVTHRSLSPLLGGGGAISNYLSMSADGRYMAFSSGATDLVPGQVDTNRQVDVFVYDRDTGLITLVSHRHDSATTAGSGFSGEPRLSADGRFLAFTSVSADLIPGQMGIGAAFLYDLSSRKLTLMSHTRASALRNGNYTSYSAVLSADGSVAAFVSEATDLDDGLPGRYIFGNLFLYDRHSDEVTRVSRHEPSLPPPLTAIPEGNIGSLSADGRTASFRTGGDLFLRDTVADTTLLANPPLAYSYRSVRGGSAVLSADGRFAALSATQESGISEYAEGLYLYDRAAGTFTLVNHGSDLPPLDSIPQGSPFNSVLSADGRYLAYHCFGCFRLPFTERVDEIFLYDRLSGTSTLVSRAADASRFPSQSYASSNPAISADGRYVVFWSFANNLVPGQVDGFGTPDLFVFDRDSGPAGSIALITHSPDSLVTSANTLVPYYSVPPFLPPAVFSGDGRLIAFQSVLPNLVAGQVDTNEGADIFLYNQETRANTLVSHAASSPATSGNAPSAHAGYVEDVTFSMSADSRFIVYESQATDLMGGIGDTNGAGDVFLYDRLFGTNSLVSYSGSAPRRAANGASELPRISADGRRVAFTSTATDLMISLQANQTIPAGWHNLYLQELGSGARTFVARAFRISEYSLPSLVPHLSADGRRIGFNSEASLVPGDYNGVADVYLWNQDGGEEPEGPISVSPCRLLDTRRQAERPILTSNVPRTVTAHGRCGVPDTAKQVVVKVTVLNPSGKGNLRFYPGAATGDPAGILRFERGTAHTETFTLPISANGTLTILPFVAGQGTVHGAVEVTAYED